MASSNADRQASTDNASDDPQSTMPVGVVHELAEECICPISQSLMVDPVLAEDGHTYDRMQIQNWIKQQIASGQSPPLSPQTREPLTEQRLVSNMALARTIERLVNSGRLSDHMVEEWKNAKALQRSSAISAKRDKSLANAPIGTKVLFTVMFKPKDDTCIAQDIISGSVPLRDMLGDLHLAKEGQGGNGLFGRANPTAERLLVRDVPIRLCESLPTTKEDSSIPGLLKERCTLPDAPMQESELIAAVLPSESTEDERAFGSSMTSTTEETCLVLEHVIRRLASVEGGLPAGVLAEWNILDQELQRRRRKANLRGLKQLLSRECFKLECTVHTVDDDGNFCFAVSCFNISSDPNASAEANTTRYFATLPHDLIGPGGQVVNGNSGNSVFGRAPARAAGGLFGGGGGGGLFGQPAQTDGFLGDASSDA